MKRKSLKKLVFKKQTMAGLNHFEMMRLFGGETGRWCLEPSWDYDTCNCSPSPGTTTTLGFETDECVTYEYTCDCPTLGGPCFQNI